MQRMLHLGSSDEDLQQAAELLRAGRLVAVPTETVYGLAADARNPQALADVFTAKQRPADHPLIVHLPDAAALPEWAREIPESAWQLAQAFWPGPLTLVLHKTADVPARITGGQDTVALRVPAHPVMQRLLKQFGRALAAPSANRFGRISPTRAEHVLEEFADQPLVAAVIDAGACGVGVESTIVDLTGPEIRILRPGIIDAPALAAVLGQAPQQAAHHEGPRASGRLPSHYAPVTALRLVEAHELGAPRADQAVLALEHTPNSGGFAHWLALPEEPLAYARGLYAALRQLDAVGATEILVQRPPAGPAWAAIHDRLQRAAA